MSSYQSSSASDAGHSSSVDLKKRVGAIQARCGRLCDDGWDVNELALIYEDIQSVSSLASMADCDVLADRLFNLEVYLSSFTESALIPKDTQLGEIRRLLGELDQGIAALGAVDAGGDEARGDTALVIGADDDDDDDEGEGDDHKGCILLLTGEEDFKLIPTLQGSDYLVRRCGSEEELLAALASTRPVALIIHAGLCEDLPEIGKQTASASDPAPVLIVLSADGDLEARLKAMRAGAAAYLPATTPASELIDRIVDAARPPEQDPFRVLIVEDDASQAIFAASILEKSGMQARKVLDPMEVLDALEEFDPDCILMDLYMPECEGTELTSIIRQQKRFVNTPILFLSGEQDKDKHYEALSAGGDDFLAKPIRPRHLISAVRNRVERARSLNYGELQTSGDDVTGLLERNTMIAIIDRRLQSGDLEKSGVLVIKLDRPRRLRETLGLTGMDELMKAIAGRVGHSIASSDRAGRFGDYGFCVLAEGRHMEALADLGGDLRDAINGNLYELSTGSTTAEVSVGVCPLVAAPPNAREVLFAAETAADAIADDEGGGVGLFRPPEDNRASSRDEALAETIREALDSDDFQLLFQPIVSLKGGEGQQYQTLLRMRQGEQTLPAAEFIPVAERCGLITDLDRLATQRALSVLSGHKRAGRDVRLFISQSGASLGSADRGEELERAIQEAGIDASMLVFEYKLADLLKSLPACRAFVQSLDKTGIGICIADVDEQAAAVEVLKRVPARYVKLARKFVFGPEQYNLRDVLQGLVSEVHDNDCKIIVPQVEDAGSIARLWSAGVDYIQGNFVQRPDEELSFDFAGSVF